MLYNAFAGDYNRLRDESADPAFSPTLFFPLWPGDAIMAQPSYLSREGLENLKNELAFTEGRILTLDNMINNAVIIEETQGGRATLEVGTTIAVMDQDGRSFRYTIVGSAEADPSQRNDIQRFSHRPKPVGKTGRRCSRGQRPVGRNQARSIGN